MKNSYYIKETLSTNNLLWELSRQQNLEEGFIVYTDFQTGGKGQAGNSWESETGENLLFSLLLHPVHIDINEHFLLSQIVSIGIKNVLDKYTGDIRIKWPNDIYWKDEKIIGILIENSIQNNHIKTSIAGIGVNVNQLEFKSAPNAVSLKRITGQEYDRSGLLESFRSSILDVYCNWDKTQIKNSYMGGLYRKDDFYPYKTNDRVFEARIIDIHEDGKMELETKKGEVLGFYFKEVQFVL